MIYQIDSKTRLPIQSESQQHVTCPEPMNASFVVNAQGSPVTYAPWGTDGFEIKMNLYDNTHPCTGRFFTWVVVQEHVDKGGGPFPHPLDLQVHFASAWYLDWLPAASARGVVGVQYYWDGKARLIEISTPSHWGDGHADPLVIDHRTYPQLEYMNLDARVYGAGFRRGEMGAWTIDGLHLLHQAIRRGLTRPTSWMNVATTSVFAGFELHNHQATQAGVAHAKFERWEV